MSILDPFFSGANQSYLAKGDKDFLYAELTADKRAKQYALYPFIYEKLAIDDVRAIKEEASLAQATEWQRVLYIGATDIGREAEQALLKLLEEPPAGSKILLVTQKTALLPTIESRVTHLGTFTNNERMSSKLLKLSMAERLAYIQKLTKDSDDPDLSKQEIRAELLALVETFREKARAGDVRAPHILKELADVSIAIEMQGAPAKMLLEHVAVIIS